MFIDTFSKCFRTCCWSGRPRSTPTTASIRVIKKLNKMKKNKIIWLIIILSLGFNLTITAQRGSFEMVLKEDTLRIKALREYLSYVKKDESLEKGKYAVIFRENVQRANDSLFTTNVQLVTITDNYYKYDRTPLAGYFFLDNVPFIVQVNSYFLNASKGTIDEIDAIVGNHLEKYVEPKPVFVSETMIINGKPKLLKGKLANYDDKKFKHPISIVFSGDQKHYQLFNNGQ